MNTNSPSPPIGRTLVRIETAKALAEVETRRRISMNVHKELKSINERLP